MRSSLAALLSVCLIQPVYAAQDWLQRLLVSDGQSFQGTFIYERDGHFSTHAVWRQASEVGMTERLLQLDGAGQEIFRVDGELRCMSRTLGAQGFDHQWSARNLNSERLREYYNMRVMGQSRVAGRPAAVLALIPQDKYRYAYELHIDATTGLPLKSLMVNEKGQLLERFQFVSLAPVKQLDSKLLQPTAGCKAVKANLGVVPTANWQADWLPAGFELVNAQQYQISAQSAPVIAQLYSDGLARFSVFVEALNGESAADGRNQFGPTAVVSQRVKAGLEDVMVTVVGEVPLATAERVTRSMRYVSTGSGQ